MQEEIMLLEEEIISNIKGGDFDSAYALAEELSCRGENVTPILRRAFNDASKISYDNISYISPLHKKTLRELREERKLSTRFVKAVDSFNINEFILRRPWLFKTIHTFIDRFDVEIGYVDEENDDEVNVVHEGNVVHVDFGKKNNK